MSDKTTCTSASTGTPVTTQTICNRPFIAHEHGIGDPLDPFAWNVIEGQLRERLEGREVPDQGLSSLCGSAVFFYFLLLVDKNTYKSLVWSLWYHGVANIKSIQLKPSNATKHPTSYFKANNEPKILGLDWMTLASLRDTFNKRIRYKSPDDETAGITLPHELIGWLEKIGFKHIETYELDTLANYIQLNAYFTKQDYYVISLINTELLQKGNSAFGVIPEHWVVWTSLLRSGKNAIDLNTKLTDIVHLTVFSWGKNNWSIQSNLPLNKFMLYHKTAFIVKRV
ncbi:Uncharacterised protein [Moraxella lacunata]|uniref:Uncharacterized protein n=2 Tax=Moraxella lacunata TaxID=477 RepID=A0A378QII2_MORLA|nr:hypothetical protein [Moraxella lacunata]STZ00655.1 Uncharacterised protein [Moraxella lacunata]